MGERDEKALWLALLRVPGLTAARASALVAAFGDLDQILGTSRAQLESVIGDKKNLLDAMLDIAHTELAEVEQAWLAEPRNHVVSVASHDYPPLLHELADAPAVLCVCGDPALLARPQLAIVGSRNPSPVGREIAHAFARSLAHTGLVITSGMALGIDGAAHEGALAAGGATIAIQGTGADRVYPRQHHDLAHRIAVCGALVSEFPLGAPPRREHFPRRNRLIAGLGLGTLVVEAAIRSGSLITARLAGEQGREVFAIPGSIYSPQSRGCHALIRQGAKLVETAEDIIEELGPLVAHMRSLVELSGDEKSANHPHDVLDNEHERLLTLMGFDPVDVDTLVDRSGLTAERLSAMLLDMELEGFITSGAGGKYQRMPG